VQRRLPRRYGTVNRRPTSSRTLDPFTSCAAAGYGLRRWCCGGLWQSRINAIWTIPRSIQLPPAGQVEGRNCVRLSVTGFTEAIQPQAAVARVITAMHMDFFMRCYYAG
jgi:hypothetical protein